MQIETNFYTIMPYANLCHVEVYASWDEKVVAEYVKHWTEVCSTLYSNKHWAILIDKREWYLHTPGAEEMLAHEIKATTVTKPSNWVFIIGDSEIKKWQTANALTKEDKLETKYFKTLDEGKIWLASLGYEMIP